MNTASMTSRISEKKPESRPANFTRHTTDLPAKFRNKGQWHLLALYHLLRLSDFAREGIERSGSYRFADHLYRNKASGRGWFGHWLDRRMLDLPSAQAMRRRYLRAKDEITGALHSQKEALHLLAIPCGIPRDLSEVAMAFPEAAKRIHYSGMDLDPEVLAAARTHLGDLALASVELIEGDALVATSYPRGRFDLIVSTGLGEFLDDADLDRFYWNVFDALEEGGTFFTSATVFERRSDFLMKAFEMKAHYRDKEQIEAILRTLPWKKIELEVDESGLQTFVRAVK
jgi:hypothetical protein